MNSISSLASTTCDYMNHMDIDFLGNGELKRAEFEISGRNCTDAVLIIRVMDKHDDSKFQRKQSRIYYIYSRMLGDVSDYPVPNSNMPVKPFDSVKYYIDDNLGGFARSLDLKKYAEYSNDPDDLCRFLINEKYYQSFIKRNIPVFYVPEFYEGGFIIAWIPELGQAITIARCGA